MDTLDDDARIKAREAEIERMWTEEVPRSEPATIPEHELPY